MCRATPTDPPLWVRAARVDDAAEAAAVVAGSIRALCMADHAGDPAVLDRWLANKTPEGLAAMIADPHATVWIACRAGQIFAVGQTTRAGHPEGGGKITLNYVAPAHRGTGASGALLDHMERVLAEDGVTLARLTSTITARAFYLSRGWRPSGPPRTGRWITDHPMEKTLPPAPPGA